MHFLNILIAEMKLQYWDKKKYPIRTIIQVLILAFLIVGFFKGSNIISGNSMKNLQPSLLIGYVLFICCVPQIISFPGIISGLREIGVLEQIYLSPVKFSKILLSKILHKIISKIIFSIVLLYLIMFLSNSWYHIDLIKFIILLIISLISIFGLGMVMAGLELVYRKILQINFFIMIIYAYLMTLTAYPINFLSFIPFIGGAYTINQTIVYNKKLPISWYIFITILSIIYFILGLIIFQFLEKKSKKKNRLCKA